MKRVLQNNVVLILFFISMIAVISLLFYTRSLMNGSIDLLLNSAQARLIAISSSASKLVSAEELDQIHSPEDTEKEIYSDIKSRLHDFSEEWSLTFTYFLRLMPDGRLQYIADNITEPERFDEMDGPADFIEPGDPLYEAPIKAINGEVVTSGIFVPDIDGLMAAYRPVYDKDGNIYCIVGVDIEDSKFIDLKRKLPFLNTVQILTIIVAFIMGFIGVMLYRNKALLSNQASIAKSNFLANMSHEIRTPINAIIGMTHIAKASSETERKDYCLDKIEDASAHLLGIINDILDMSKIEANKFTLSVTDFDFEKMVQKAVNIINFKVDEKHQELSVFIDKSIPQRINGDEQRLKQVLTNLLANAVKFTPERGLIRLEAKFLPGENETSAIQFDVTDTGIGISESQQERLFDSFQQGDESISRKFGGTGLGLAISKHIVEMMGGKIWIVSQPNKGATFSFTINAKQAVSKKDNPAPSLIRKDARILAVDDSEEILKYFDDVCDKAGVKCDTAANGKEALNFIEKNGGYDIYFIDWKMPVMNGLELAAKIKNLGKASVIIMISATEWNLMEAEAKKIGIDKFLPKPLFRADIAGAIDEFTAESPQAANGGKKEQSVSFKGKRMLLVDDVAINREIVSSVLKPTGIEIEEAENGAQALEMFKKDPQRYDIIFMDIQMPEIDGYQATRQIRAIGTETAKNVPIIAMTANAYKEDVDKTLQSGMNAHLAKPIDINAVMEVLKRFLQ